MEEKNNKKTYAERKKIEMDRRNELEKMIAVTGSTIESGLSKAESMLPSKGAVHIDYYEMKANTDEESNNLVDSIVQFYLDDAVSGEIDYVKQKAMVDKITVSSLLFQMKTSEHAIIKLLTEIDDGNIHARTFEVLAGLQRAKMDIIKHMAQFMVIMENGYKNFKEDYRYLNETTSQTVEMDEDPVSGGFKTRGSKALIQAMQELREEEDFEPLDDEKEK